MLECTLQIYQVGAEASLCGNVLSGPALIELHRNMKQTAEQELSVCLMKAPYSEGRATVGSALLPGRVAFDQTLSTPDIYTPARFATCHKTSALPLPSHTGQG